MGENKTLEAELKELRSELVEQERHSARIEEILKRAVTRLAVLAAEVSPELDQPLKNLRDVIRDQVDPERIQPLLTHIERVARQEGETQRQGAFTDQGADLLRQLFTELRSVSELSDEIRRLEAEADDAGPRELERITSQLAQRLKQFAGKEGDSSEVCEVLTELLERLALSGELAERADRIKQLLEKCPSGDQLAQTVRTIGDLVDRIQLTTQSDREELEGFLRQVDEQLRGLMAGLEDTENLRRESLEQGRLFHDDMSAQFDEIEAGIAGASSLEEHKRSITEQMRALRARLDQHREEDLRRSAAAEEQIRRLTLRLQNVEKESGELRKNLAKAREAAHRDPLTGLYNRLGYEAFLTQEHQRWKRYKTPLSLVVMDIDFFKKINDSYGHKAGDKVLRAIAGRLQKMTREPDFLARFGGEEFVLVMPETDRQAAFTVAEKLRTAIAGMGFTYRGKPVQITVSVGVTEFQGEDAPDDAFVRADQAMYQAKSKGRNCSVLN
ncbi:MAG: GGDEF domain-containing protein [Gammaproteobacteria bacterium]